VNLPVDASPIDFAYALNKKTGNHILSVRVDQKKVTLNTKLKNGNIVEIITSPNSHPTKSWLKYAKTAHAKDAINSYLKKYGK